jgi:hypothetical protein
VSRKTSWIRPQQFTWAFSWVALVSIFNHGLTAQEAAPTDFKTESGRAISLVVTGLNNPTGVAMQPETGEVFIADSGNGQVVRLFENKITPVITNFPTQTLPTEPRVKVGPLSLAFLNKNNLLVGNGGQLEDSLQQFVISDSATPANADTAKTSLTLFNNEGENQAEGNFSSVAVGPTFVLVTSQGQAGRGWVSLGNRPTGDAVTDLTRHIATTDQLKSSTPSAISITPHGYALVANLGSLGPDRDSVAGFFEITSKRLLLKLDLGLRDVSALSYSPRRQMYALDLSWTEPAEGGLFRVIEDTTSPTKLVTKLIARLPYPTAMCFDSDGGLFVTLRGLVDAEGNTQGSLVYIPAEENL